MLLIYTSPASWLDLGFLGRLAILCAAIPVVENMTSCIRSCLLALHRFQDRGAFWKVRCSALKFRCSCLTR